jgi:hypothetical protein
VWARMSLVRDVQRWVDRREGGREEGGRERDPGRGGEVGMT